MQPNRQLVWVIPIGLLFWFLDTPSFLIKNFLSMNDKYSLLGKYQNFKQMIYEPYIKRKYNMQRKDDG